jgi:hypothetical protein
MPKGLIVSPGAISYCSKENIRERVLYFRNYFYEVQQDIAEALEGNYSANRYALLQHLFKKLIHHDEAGENYLAEESLLHGKLYS